jgi:glutamate racemase
MHTLSLIAPQINEYYAGRVEIIDSSLIVAKSVQSSLAEKKLLAPTHPAERHFFVSDYTEAFENSTQLFFSDKINLEYYPLWE